jgi:hypothetical protein
MFFEMKGKEGKDILDDIVPSPYRFNAKNISESNPSQPFDSPT